MPARDYDMCGDHVASSCYPTHILTEITGYAQARTFVACTSGSLTATSFRVMVPQKPAAANGQ